MNNLKLFVLIAGLTALFGAVGYSFGGRSGMVLALILAGVMNFIGTVGEIPFLVSS